MLKLMIVDDSNIIRAKIQRACDHDSFNVVAVARDGDEALSLALRHQPEVVTMDLTMPRLDGIGCISHLCDMLPEVLILVVSALSDEATGIEALERGASGFLLKPFADEQLRDALCELTNHLA